MNKTFKIKPIVLAIAGSVSLLSATPAFAVTVIDPALIATVKASTSTIGMAISTSTSSIIQMLRTMMGANDSAAMKIADVVGHSANNTVQRANDLAQLQQNRNIERSLQQPIDPCANAGMGFVSPSSRNFRPGGAFGGNIMNKRFTGSSGNFKTGSASLNNAIDIAEGNRPAPAVEVQALLAHQGGCEAYAFGTRAQACVSAGIQPGAVKYPNADTNASSLFDGAQTKDDMGKVSLTFNEEQLSAAKAYLRNLTNPLTMRDLTPAEARTDAGRQYFAMRDAHAAKIDMALNASQEWASDQSPYKDNVPVLKAMLEGQGAAAAYVASNVATLGPKGGNWERDGVSNNAMLTVEANRRANNPAWIAELANVDDPMTLQREQLAVSAHTNYLLTKMLFSQNKQRALLGAIHQAATDRDFMPDLLAAHKKATSTAR